MCPRCSLCLKICRSLLSSPLLPGAGADAGRENDGSPTSARWCTRSGRSGPYLRKPGHGTNRHGISMPPDGTVTARRMPGSRWASAPLQVDKLQLVQAPVGPQPGEQILVACRYR